MKNTISNILIGGTSHVGKSTLGSLLAEELSREVLSTDKLTRHPGRPWPQIPSHVAEFYNSMSADNIYTFLVHHHENTWPRIEKLIEDNQRANKCAIIEGTALRPEYLTKLNNAKNACLCLYANTEMICSRIHADSNYDSLSSYRKKLIDVFIERSLRDNEAIIESATRNNIELINAADPVAITQLMNTLIKRC